MTWLTNPHRFGGAGAAPWVTDGLIIHLDATNRGSTENQWDDLSGNGNHFVAASAGEFPAFAGGLATFDGSNDHLDGPNLSALDEGEVFARLDGPPNTVSAFETGIWEFGVTGSADHYPYTDNNVYQGFGSTTRAQWTSGGTTTRNLHTLNIWSASEDWAMRVNGTTRVSRGTNTVSFPNPVVLGRSLAGFYFKGTVAAIFVYNRKLTAGERTQMEGYVDGLPI